MNYYFAPLEGITGYIFRSAHAACFPGTDRYFSPFLVPHQNRAFDSRERNDILPEHNQKITLIPQILTNRPEDFLRLSGELARYGYRELNLNLGCPSGTVVTRGKGSGFLRDPDGLDRFLDEVCRGLEQTRQRLSVKTRIGWESAEEWPRLLKIFNRYPLAELILHPRLRTDFYKNTPHMDAYAYTVSRTPLSLCYNGDLKTPEDIRRLEQDFPQTASVMIGRGLLEMPDLICRVKGAPPAPADRLREFHGRLLDGYCGTISGDRNVLFKMKEFWSYFGKNFPEKEKDLKKLKKTKDLKTYREIAATILETA